MIPNFGQDGSFAGTETAQGNADGNGYGDFYYAPPSGYLALCTKNLATELAPTIDDPSAYFQIKLYSGNNTETAITYDGNSNLQPDFIWAKSRTNTYWHDWRDTSRGINLRLASNTTDAEGTKSASYVSFDSNGFTLGDDIQGGSPANTTNSSGDFVSWGWRVNSGTTSSNTDGSITSTVQANTTAGFSIVLYTGIGTAGATIGHGLGKTPSVMIVKNRIDTGVDWPIYHAGNTSAPETEFLKLNTTEATIDTLSIWNDTAPTSSVFTVGTSNGTNGSGDNYVAYCFADIEGYSKFGKYIGNGSDNGPFVYTGFRPAWIMYKNTSRGTAGAAWWIWDNKRNTFNVVDNYLIASDSRVEGNFDSIDFTSNGFKLRTSDGGQNASGETIIYMAFAENPFVTSGGLPVTAR